MSRAAKQPRAAKPTADASPKALALADLAHSGLGAAEARALRLEALTPDQTAALDPSFKRAAALRIPYFTLAGRPTPFYRLRYLALNGFDAFAHKPLRYVQPPGTAPEVYFPPLGGFRWDALATAADRALLITEGEKKAAAATAAGFPTIGLGGVWSWKSKRLGVGLLPVLRDAFAWRDRAVYFVFDSDARRKPGIAQALNALATELGALGAKPRVAVLPDLVEGAKTGLDDFLVASGKAALAELLLKAEPFSLTEELWKLNAEVVYVRSPGFVVVLRDGLKLTPAAFKDHAYANRYYHERGVTKDGDERLVKKPLAPAWLAWERRSELERVTYAPGEPRITARGEYNAWDGWGCEPRRGGVGPWVELLDFMFAGAPDSRRWFERWAAYPLRRPGTKLYTSTLIWGATQGTGKSLIGLSLAKIYGRNATLVNDQHLASAYNEWAECKQFVMGDDVMSGEHRARIAVADRLKAMITQEEIRINAKYVPSYVVPDCLNYYFTANHPDAFFLDDTDRRNFIHEAPPAVLPAAFYQRYDRWLRSGELGPALFWHLLHLDLGDFDPHAPALETTAKRAMINDAKSDLAAWVLELRENPDGVLRLGDVPVRGDLFTNKQLLALYDPADARRVTANGLGRELKRAGFRQVAGGVTVATARGPVRLYAVRNAEKWFDARPEAIRRHYDETRGGAEGDSPAAKKF